MDYYFCKGQGVDKLFTSGLESLNTALSSIPTFLDTLSPSNKEKINIGKIQMLSELLKKLTKERGDFSLLLMPVEVKTSPTNMAKLIVKIASFAITEIGYIPNRLNDATENFKNSSTKKLAKTIVSHEEIVNKIVKKDIRRISCYKRYI